MKIKALRTEVFSKEKNLVDFIHQHVAKVFTENSILAVTSKIVSLSEGQTVSKKNTDKQSLIKKESEYYLGKIAYDQHLAIRHGLLVPSAGIDESNSEKDEYILYPQDPFSSAKKIRTALKKKLGLKNLGVLITDSHTIPLRRGVIGMALAYSGFKAIKNLIGTKDLFGRPLRVTTVNVAEALAVSAVLLMGEGAERCPLAVIEKAPVVFTNKTNSKEMRISPQEDLYAPFLFKKNKLK